MRVPLLDLSEQYRQLAGPIRDKIDKVLSSQRFILGENVAAFEESMCRFLGVSHADRRFVGNRCASFDFDGHGDRSGRRCADTGLQLFRHRRLHCARWGDASVHRHRSGDVQSLDRRAYAYIDNHSQAQSGKLLTENGATIRAIIPVHLFGLCCDMDPIHEISERYQLDVIEDAAQAIGAECPTKHMGIRKAGTMGEVGCFSFYPSKNLGAAGDAGLVACRDDELAKQLRSYRQHGMEPRYIHHVHRR